MGKIRNGRASWFRMFLNLKPMIDAVPEASAGAALKAAFAYFDTGEVPSGLDQLANALFLAIKPAIDESVSDYQTAVNNGHRGGKRRWSREEEDSPPIPHLSPPIPPLSNPIGWVTETEKETETEIEKDIDIETDAPGAGRADSGFPKQLQKEIDFNTRRKQALEMLEGYTG